MPPRSRKTRGRDAAAFSADVSSDSEPEQHKQRQSPQSQSQREESDDEGASAANNNDDAADEEEDSPAPNDRTSSSYNSSNDPGDNTSASSCQPTILCTVGIPDFIFTSGYTQSLSHGRSQVTVVGVFLCSDFCE